LGSRREGKYVSGQFPHRTRLASFSDGFLAPIKECIGFGYREGCDFGVMFKREVVPPAGHVEGFANSSSISACLISWPFPVIGLHDGFPLTVTREKKYRTL
jgi:hypothetical protein